MPETMSFLEISFFFDGELRALHDFNTELGAHADSFDREKRTAAVESFLASVGVDTPSVTLPQDREAEDLASPTSPDQSLRLLSETLALILTQPDHPRYNTAKGIGETLLRTARTLPSHGAYLRRGLLSNLTTTFEALLSQLLKNFYVRYPRALKAEDRTLSLADLRVCESIDAAERLLVQREIDSLLFKPFDELLNNVLRRFPLPAALLEQQHPILEELFLRRNLFVHNLGVVNRQYLSRVPRQLFPDSMPQEGTTLPLDTHYLTEVINTVLVVGVILLQATWAKWEPEERNTARLMLTHHIYESLIDQHYHVITGLAQYAYTLKDLSDSLHKVILINHAIALRELNNPEDIPSLLTGTDWSSAALMFRMAVEILEGRYMTALELVKKALAVSEITRYDLQRWPLFTPIRAMPEFQALLVTARAPSTAQSKGMGSTACHLTSGHTHMATEPGAFPALRLNETFSG